VELFAMKKLSEITEVKIPSDFDEMVDALSSADGFMERVVLYCDRDLCTVLEEMKFANRNVRGSYGGGKALTELYRKEDYKGVYEAVVKFCKKNNIKVLVARVSVAYEEVK
jgi:hypothetical protein